MIVRLHRSQEPHFRSTNETNFSTMNRQNWLICGCDSIFADHLVRTVLAYGDRVIAAAPDPDAIRHLEAMGATILPLSIVEDPTELDRKIRDISAYFGRLDVVVQNAGLGPLGALEDLR